MLRSNKNSSSLLYRIVILSSWEFDGVHKSEEKNWREYGCRYYATNYFSLQVFIVRGNHPQGS